MRRLLAGLPCLISLASATVHYKLSPQPAAKTITVSVTVDLPKSVETFRIPAWCPGYYQIANYQKKIFDVKATDSEGNLLQMESPDSRTWKVFGGGRKEATLSYKVLGDDPGLGFFAVNVQSDKTFINGAAAFMYVDGHNTEDVSLNIKSPAGWDVATAMTSGDNQDWVAANYDEFIDNPIQLGVFTRKTFKLMGVPFEVIFVAPENAPRCDLDLETERLKTVSKPALKMFRRSSFKKYLYILHLEIGNFSGGLEHRSCNVQAVSNGSELHLDDLAAHEYFHAWNVKQIRPSILGPFDYTKPQRTANLWFAEGVTDYYSKLHTFQSGIRNETWLLAQMSDQIRELQSGRTRKTKTVEEASKGCWEQDGFSVGDLSFYTKGLIAGLILDAAIIDASHGTKTLDDVMRALYLKHEIPKPGYQEDELRTTINDVAGADLSDLYRQLIQSTDEVPYSIASKIGLRILVPNASRNVSPSSHGSDFSVEPDPDATAQTKNYYKIWLHRLNSIE